MTRRTPAVELLWFADCPNHPTARAMLRDAMTRHGVTGRIVEIDATDPTVASDHRFPGSPTIRVDGLDIDPTFVDPGDYAPRCRLYRTTDGLSGLPDVAWIDAGLARSGPDASH